MIIADTPLELFALVEVPIQAGVHVILVSGRARDCAGFDLSAYAEGSRCRLGRRRIPRHGARWQDLVVNHPSPNQPWGPDDRLPDDEPVS